MSATVIAILHHAGGVGKTTSTLNLGYEMARLGKRVLLVDIDSQGNLSSRVGVEDQGARLIEPMANKYRKVEPVHLAWGGYGLDLLPSDLNMAGLTLRLHTEQSREKRLRRVINSVRDNYDYVLIDCPPSLDLMTTNALWAADGVLVPVQAQDKAYRALPLLGATLMTVGDHRTDDNPDDKFPRFDFYFATMVDRRYRMSAEIIDALKADYGDGALETVIPYRAEAQNDARHQAPISDYAPRDDSAEAYRQLAREVISRVEASFAPTE